jgi:hypothetical protein
VWESTAPPPAHEPEDVMMACTEYRVVGAADVFEVLAWASRTVLPSQAYELFVETGSRSPALVRLAGPCPADPDERLRWEPSGA